MPAPLPYSDAIETIPADEPADSERMLDVLRELLRLHRERTGRYERDVHVKAHGCARGEFRVASNLPGELAQGLFARAASYPAVVRFSNSAPWAQSDLVPDGRGLAIQIEQPPGVLLDASAGTQDFLMANHPTFIARDVKDYLRLQKARLAAGGHPIKLVSHLLTGAWSPWEARWREPLAAARIGVQRPAHPANYTYYSMVPIRYGHYVAKYRVERLATNAGSFLGQAAQFALHSDAMRRLLTQTLAEDELTFEFQVQLRTAASSMPMEDATIEWPESESPYRTVAHLVLPRQDISAPETCGDCEPKTFNVWNALVEHRPLGGINRVRRLAYALSAETRLSTRP